MTTLTALTTAMNLANAAKGGMMADISDVEYDDIAIALAAAQPDLRYKDTDSTDLWNEAARRVREDLRPAVEILAGQPAPTAHEALNVFHAIDPVKRGLARLTTTHVELVLEALDEDLDKYDSHRLFVAERRVEQLEAQLAAAPVSAADYRAARCWFYFYDNHPRQIAAALNCSDYEIDERMRDVVQGARP